MRLLKRCAVHRGGPVRRTDLTGEFNIRAHSEVTLSHAHPEHLHERRVSIGVLAHFAGHWAFHDMKYPIETVFSQSVVRSKSLVGALS